MLDFGPGDDPRMRFYLAQSTRAAELDDIDRLQFFLAILDGCPRARFQAFLDNFPRPKHFPPRKREHYCPDRGEPWSG